MRPKITGTINYAPFDGEPETTLGIMTTYFNNGGSRWRWWQLTQGIRTSGAILQILTKRWDDKQQPQFGATFLTLLNFHKIPHSQIRPPSISNIRKIYRGHGGGLLRWLLSINASSTATIEHHLRIRKNRKGEGSQSATTKTLDTLHYVQSAQIPVLLPFCSNQAMSR